MQEFGYILNRTDVTFINFKIKPQPNDTTCGPTCLHAIYQYYQDSIKLKQVIREVQTIKGGGTLGVHLANHALLRKYQVKIYTYNLHVFDPTWFRSPFLLEEKLKQQMHFKKDKKLRKASKAYLKFLSLGGTIHFEDLTPQLIRKFLKKSIPILTGLSATYLYHSQREYGKKCIDDDIKGDPTGHFVIFSGYHSKERSIHIADPLDSNPLTKSKYYTVPIERALGAILLGIVTYDSNFIVIKPKK